MRKILFLFLSFTFASAIAAKCAFADNSFKTFSKAVYTVSESGITHVAFTNTLENTTDRYYASSYNMTLGFDHITNLHASDPGGYILPKLSQKNGLQIATLNFNVKSVGNGTKLTFTMSFDTPDIAKKAGHVWEVTVPGIENQQEFEEFDVKINVPKNFGSPAFIKPDITSPNLEFTKAQLGEAGISLGFGTAQIYAFSLTYHLANKNLFPVETEIALPPDTNYQKIFIDSMRPKPTNVVRDADGNWLAKYDLMPSQKKDVLVDGKAYVDITPRQSTLSDTERKLYTKEQPYWETTNPEVRKLANELKTPESIYNYTVNHLQYDYSRVTDNQVRLGAAGILAKPNNAVCLEFTDLFIAMARAAGIPAREVDGFAYTQNPKERPLSLVKDILHAWPEYYDSKSKEWVMIDPTWGNTTHGTDYFNSLDFDHLAFTIKGADSSYPVPAGGYKLAGHEDTKDVRVTFGGKEAKEKPVFTGRLDFPGPIGSGTDIDGNFLITNTGNSSIPAQRFSVESPFLHPHSHEQYAPEVPPFGSVIVPITFSKTPFLTNRTADATIHFNKQTFVKSFTIYPFFPKSIVRIGGVLFAGLTTILSFITHTTGHISLPRK